MKNKLYSFSSKPHSEYDKYTYGFGGMVKVTVTTHTDVSTGLVHRRG